MSRWFVLREGRRDIIGEVMGAFRRHYGEPVARPEDDACVFYRIDVWDEAPQTVTLYFSPAASALADHYGALDCREPNKRGLRLLVGDRLCELMTEGPPAVPRRSSFPLREW